MKTHAWILAGAIASVSTAAVAADVPGSPTRAQVKKSVADARAAGQLSIGEAASYPAAADRPSKGVKLHRKAKKPAATDAAK